MSSVLSTNNETVGESECPRLSVVKFKPYFFSVFNRDMEYWGRRLVVPLECFGLSSYLVFVDRAVLSWEDPKTVSHIKETVPEIWTNNEANVRICTKDGTGKSIKNNEILRRRFICDEEGFNEVYYKMTPYSMGNYLHVTMVYDENYIQYFKERKRRIDGFKLNGKSVSGKTIQTEPKWKDIGMPFGRRIKHWKYQGGIHIVFAAALYGIPNKTTNCVQVVRHWNDDGLDNRSSNLGWGTPSMNSKDKHRNRRK